MKINASNQLSTQPSPSAYILGLFKGKNPNHYDKTTTFLDQKVQELTAQIIKEDKFNGEVGSTVTFRTGQEAPAQKIILVGLGDEAKFNLDTIRIASAAAIKAATGLRAQNVLTMLPESGNGNVSAYETALEMVETSQSALYRFNKYKSQKQLDGIDTFTIVETDEKKLKEIEAGIKRGEAISQARSLARYIMNEPANYMTPTQLAITADKVARENDLQIEVLDLDTCVNKYGMGAFKAVAQGSKEPAKFIIIKYEPRNKPRKHIALVGKGVTFDAGGLDLKSRARMEPMRFDKGGAASVIATMSLMKELQPDVAITAIVPATENMPGGGAMRPGDIVRAMNGKSIEILDTDLEGRLILADGIAYAVSLGADEIIDVATLTPEAALALGLSYTALMSNDKELTNRIVTAGNKCGEKMWELPLDDDYRDYIQSNSADIKNTGPQTMIGDLVGAQIGAVFLENFIVDSKGNATPWVHLDISGSGWPNPKLEAKYGLAGPPGVAVRTFANYLTEQG